MNRLDQMFQTLSRAAEKALVCYFPLGDPLGGDPVDLAGRYADAGVDVLEIGLPWHAPVLDGPTIRGSMERATAAGVTPPRFFEQVAQIRHRFPALPIEVMTYQGQVEAIGLAEFSRLCAAAGVDAVIVPDNTTEQRHALDRALLGHGLYPLRFAWFDLTPDVLADIAGNARGYVFVQAKPGVTGAGDSVHPGVRTNLATLRSAGTTVPLVPGFGFSKPEQVRQACEWGADGAVVGSAVVQQMARGLDDLSAYLRQMKQATRES